jgi:hypothetical protein
MGLISFFRSLRDTSPSAAQARADAIHLRVSRLSSAEAELQARERILKRDPFRSSDAAPNDVKPAGFALLPSDLRSLLGQFRQIELGGMQIDRAEIAPYHRHSGWVRIGSDLEHAAIVVRPADGHVFVIEEDGSGEPNLADEYASIWHYLLEVAEATQVARK